MGHSTGVRKVIGDDIGRNVRLRSAGRIPALVGARCPGIMVRDGNGRLSTRMPQPAGRSTAARSWPSSGQEIRWRQCRGCACYTYHSDARPNLLKLSESLVGTTESFLGRSPGRYPEPLPSKLK